MGWSGGGVTVLTGGFSRGELEEAGASAVLASLPELTARLDLLAL